jgi:thiol-disulfide isomerase/thioredoxin
MNKLILIFVLAVSINILSRDWSEFKCASNDILLVKSDQKKAPNFTLKSVEGKTVKLSDYKGKVVIIDFWATWCPPCRRGIPDLISIQKEYKKNVVVIGISLDAEKTINDIPGFIKENGINYPIVYGDDKVVTDYGGIRSIPTSFVIDKQGNVADMHVGLVEKDVFVKKIDELLKKK